MIDIKFIEDNYELVLQSLNKRQGNYEGVLKKVLKLNEERKELIKVIEDKKAKKNQITKTYGDLVKRNQSIVDLKNEVLKINEFIESRESDFKKIVDELNNCLLEIPNIPNENIPLGVSDEDNLEVRTWPGLGLKKDGEAHWDIATKLNLVDFELGSKLSGARFLVYTGKGSKMVRAIADVLLTRHTKNGYKEISVPLLVNKEIMFGTGQLPKFEDDAYKIDDKYLIPTSEVPLTNLVRNETLKSTDLPIYLTSFSQCFRREAGSAGRDTKGMIRLHQFNKVEMVKITDETSSFIELEKMVTDAEDCLKLFNIPYRVVELCGGDIGFSSKKTYDLEVWFPNQNKYREISSCSNCGDFQARRMKAKYRDKEGKTKYVHTLNGSGLAIDRLFAAILENYYDGQKLILPEVLKPYFNGDEFITQ